MVEGLLIAAGVLVAIAIVLAAFHLRQPRLTEPLLQGTWQSDAEATIAEWRKGRPLNENQERLLKRTFGRLKITYQNNNCRTEIDGLSHRGTFRVVSKQDDSAVIKARLFGMKAQVFKIRFAGHDIYWLYLDDPGTWECFRRVEYG